MGRNVAQKLIATHLVSAGDLRVRPASQMSQPTGRDPPASRFWFRAISGLPDSHVVEVCRHLLVLQPERMSARSASPQPELMYSAYPRRRVDPGHRSSRTIEPRR